MDRIVNELLDEAKKQTVKGDVAYAIWLVESAISLSGERIVRSLYPTIFDITLDEIKRCGSICEEYQKKINRIILYKDDLTSEEWALVISDLSLCHSIDTFAKRVGYEIALSLDKTFDAVRQATDNFTYPAFVRQLSELRRRWPNPLPELR